MSWAPCPRPCIELGVEVKVLMPYYGMVKQGKVPTSLIAEDLEVNLGPINHTFNLMAPDRPGFPLLFRGAGRVLRPQPALRHPPGGLLRQPGALRLFLRRGSALLPGPGL